MIDRAVAVLHSTKWPTWEEDTPMRRELEHLKEDVHAYKVAEMAGGPMARRRAAYALERADRIAAFTAGRRCGADHPVRRHLA